MDDEKTLTAEFVDAGEDLAAVLEAPVGGLGGVPEALTLETYKEMHGPSAAPYVDALADLLDRTEGYVYGEDMNECDIHFSDGTWASFSWRAWGDFASAWHNSRFGTSYDYMKFYMRGI